MGNLLRLDQKWDFRRKDDSNDSSSDDDLKSDSVLEPILKKHKPVFSPTTETSRLQTDQNPETPNEESRIKSRKAEKKDCERRKNDAFEDVNKKRGKKTVVKNGTAGSAEPEASLEGVQSFMKSLLEDLNASREKLFEWMTIEMGEDDTCPQKKTRRANNGRKRKVQPPGSKKNSKRTQVQGNDNEQNKQDCAHTHNEQPKETVFADERSMLEKHVDVQVSQNMGEAQNIGDQDQFNCKLDVRAQDCNFGPLEMFLRSSEVGLATSCFQGQQRVQDSQTTEFETPTHKVNGKSLVSDSFNKPCYQPKSESWNVPAENQKSLVLGIRAPSWNLGTFERSLKGKKSIEPKPIHKPPKYQKVHEVTSGSIASSAENYIDRNLEPLIDQRLSSNLLVPSGYYPWCSTSPSLITDPTIANHGSTSSASNHVQMRRGTQPLDSFDNQGHFLVNHPEKANRSFAQLGSRNSNCFYQNNKYFSGFPMSFHQGINSGLILNNQVSLDNLQRENNGIMGLRMTGGGIRFSGGSNSLPEHYSGTNIINLPDHNLPDHRTNVRQVPYGVHNINNSPLFQK